MQNFILNNGVTMPQVGFGVFQVGNDETEKTVLSALEAGYRLIDTAAIYGNEEGVGKAIKASGIDRSEIFVTTKLFVQTSNAFENTKKAFDESLKRLGLDYVDLYLIHQPYGDVHEKWRAMQQLYQAGKTRAIGVSNFHTDRLMDLMTHHEVIPAVNQIETHPFYQREAELAFHQEMGIVQQAWAPLAEAKFDILNNTTLAKIARKHNKTVAQVILRWLNQRGIAIIPKSVKPERMHQNLEIFGFELDAQDMAEIASLNRDEIIMNLRDPRIVKWIVEMA